MKNGLTLHLTFHGFSTFNCCLTLSVVSELDKGDYPENSHVVFCPNKQRSFEPFICLDLIFPDSVLLLVTPMVIRTSQFSGLIAPSIKN